MALKPEDIAYRRKSGGRTVNVSRAAAEKERAAIARCHKENSVAIAIRFSKERDAAILKKLDEVESKTGYIRELINKDIGGER